MTFYEVGQTGLRQFSGWVREEFLTVLVGRQGAQKYREMRDNSPTIGGMLFAMEAEISKVEWRVEKGEDGGSQEYADFVESCMNDMSSSWSETISDHLSFLTYGFAWSELVYKKRLGRDPGMNPRYPDEELPKSEYDDGKVGWRRMPGRSQDTIIKWFFDRNGQVKGTTQQPWVGPLIDMPIDKAILHRPTHYKANPEGRALDPETMIPTPDGWRKLDDLAVGDKVFDERGMIRYVTARADWNNRPCYRLRFGDSTEIIADENHQWVTRTLSDRNRGIAAKVRTTAKIASTVKTQVDSSNHSIAWAEPLDYPEQMLPLHPYFLGQWLGDGTSLASQISCHAQDVEETVALIASCGYQPQVVSNGREDGNGRLIKVFGDGAWDSQGPQALLRALGLRGNKHIPAAYLRGSIEQRRALLAGLMDSDGTVDTYGRCEFNNCDTGLIYGVAELVRSLGCSAYVSLNGHAGTGNRKQNSWGVKFRPEWSPFRLSRKAARIRGHRARDQHYITQVESVESRRTVCIEVDSPSHMFLAGEAMIPTHNSILRNAYIPYYYGKRLQEQEAILFERLGGVPVIYIPGQILQLASTGDSNALAQVNMYKRIAVNLRTDEQMGLVLPSDTYEGVNGPGTVGQYRFELVAPQMRAASINLNETIGRYNISMLTSVLADFLTLGHEARGTQSLAVTKVDMFMSAIEGYLNAMAQVYNKYAVTRLMDFNAMNLDQQPKIKPDLAQRVDLDVLSNYVLRLAQAGMPLFPDDDVQSYLKDAAGLPDIDDSRALQAAGLTDEQLDREDEKGDVMLDQLKNPPPVAGPGARPGGTPKPAANQNEGQKKRENLEVMLKGAIAQRMVRHAGPKFGVRTGHVHKGNHKQPSVRRLTRMLREVQG